MNIIRNVAFIIPIHPKHYHFIYKFIDNIKENNINIDIFLVFSDEKDFLIFDKKNNIREIIMPNIHTNNIVTYKKFFALDKLKQNTEYDYFIVCDAEIDIIPENFTESNMLDKINKIYNNKIIYAGEVQDMNVKNITNTSCNLICNDSKLENITKNYRLYYWWSDLPIYKRDHLLIRIF
jgi:hypothetical protein